MKKTDRFTGSTGTRPVVAFRGEPDGVLEVAPPDRIKRLSNLSFIWFGAGRHEGQQMVHYKPARFTALDCSHRPCRRDGCRIRRAARLGSRPVLCRRSVRRPREVDSRSAGRDAEQAGHVARPRRNLPRTHRGVRSWRSAAERDHLAQPARARRGRRPRSRACRRPGARPAPRRPAGHQGQLRFCRAPDYGRHARLCRPYPKDDAFR